MGVDTSVFGSRSDEPRQPPWCLSAPVLGRRLLLSNRGRGDTAGLTSFALRLPTGFCESPYYPTSWDIVLCISMRMVVFEGTQRVGAMEVGMHRIVIRQQLARRAWTPKVSDPVVGARRILNSSWFLLGVALLTCFSTGLPPAFGWGEVARSDGEG